VQANILDAMPDADVRVYAIFFEIVAGDEGAKYDVDPKELLDDPRVTLYWDEDRTSGYWFEDNVTRVGKRAGEEGRIEWDAFILYGNDVEWSDEPPRSVSWGRPVIQEKLRLLQSLEAALARSRE
jgi:hypothetical protein